MLVITEVAFLIRDSRLSQKLMVALECVITRVIDFALSVYSGWRRLCCQPVTTLRFDEDLWQQWRPSTEINFGILLVYVIVPWWQGRTGTENQLGQFPTTTLPAQPNFHCYYRLNLGKIQKSACFPHKNHPFITSTLPAQRALPKCKHGQSAPAWWAFALRRRRVSLSRVQGLPPITNIQPSIFVSFT